MPDSRLVSGLFVSKGTPLAYVTSASTFAQVVAAIEDNASYDMVGDATMCREYIVACRVYLRRLADELWQGDVKTKDTPEKVQRQLAAAESWLSSNDTSAATAGTGSNRVLMPSLGNWR